MLFSVTPSAKCFSNININIDMNSQPAQPGQSMQVTSHLLEAGQGEI